VNSTVKTPARELLREVQRRLPAGQYFVQEAFTAEHRHPVMVKLGELRPDTFYVFDEVMAWSLCEAVVDWSLRRGGARLTLSYPAYGEAQARQHRLQHIAGKVDRIRVLATGRPGAPIPQSNGIEFLNISGNPLMSYRIAMVEGRAPMLFISRDVKWKPSDRMLSLGFFTHDGDTIDDVSSDIDLVMRGLARRVAAFERLELLHQTTQRISRELESYSRRMELAVQRARRRPDLLTPARFDRIVGQAIVKMEQLKEIPRRALRSMDRPRR